MRFAWMVEDTLKGFADGMRSLARKTVKPEPKAEVSAMASNHKGAGDRVILAGNRLSSTNSSIPREDVNVIVSTEATKIVKEEAANRSRVIKVIRALGGDPEKE